MFEDIFSFVVFFVFLLVIPLFWLLWNNTMGNTVTVQKNSCLKTVDLSGNEKLHEGPCRVSIFRKQHEMLERFTADDQSYLKIKYMSGETEHRQGPSVEFLNPSKHLSISVEPVLTVNINEAFLISADNKTGMSHTIIKGPTFYMPQPNETCKKLTQHMALKKEYLKIKHLDGTFSHIPGPVKMFLDPREHRAIDTCRQLELAADEVCAVYEEDGGQVKCSFIQGPKLYMLAPNQWAKTQATFTADQNMYLVVEYLDGKKEHKKGPYSMYFNPQEHKHISIQAMTNVNSHQIVVIYAENEGTVTRRILRGPARFMIQPNEWLHVFKWHGRDPKSKDPEKKIPGALVFDKMSTLPDQFYFKCENVRTKDEAMLDIRLMIFFELENIEIMLDWTTDPIADFINSCSADIMSFVSKLTYEEFVGHTEELNKIATFTNLVDGARRIGFTVTRVVYRGYHASTQLEEMHNKNIERRTQLRLEAETEEQNEKLADMRLTREQNRRLVERSISQEDADHEMAVQRQKHKEKMDQRREETELELERFKNQTEAEAVALARKNEELLNYYKGLNALSVNLTEVMTAEYKQPDQRIRFETNKETESTTLAPKIFLNSRQYE
eukprot:GCRY01002696.1.p1 GENE.GCRY01002696.1~~GCRY01002696.1.p1  ORF type:complete len:611 (+),score=158.59 GCRY01002696.1:108-1940(+)